MTLLDKQAETVESSLDRIVERQSKVGEKDKRDAEDEITENCDEYREHKVRSKDINLDEIMDLYYPCLVWNNTVENKQILYQKKRLAEKCNKIKLLDKLKEGQIVKIPITKAEEAEQDKCRPEQKELTRAPQEILKVSELAKEYNKIVNAFDLSQMKKDVAFAVFQIKNNPHVWHIVTHGYCSGLGYLTLKKDNGTITIQDVDEFNLDVPRLIWLHTCESGIGGRDSIMAAFLEKMTENTIGIGSLWNINDQSALKVAEMFYDKFLPNMYDNVSSILREVRLELLKSSETLDGNQKVADPYFWAVYEVFSPKYTLDFNDLDIGEAMVEFNLNQDKETCNATVQVGNEYKVIENIEINQFTNLRNSVSF
ncbi:MAG: CHAT domain-containing protein, partial [Microscillaceae bacterium]|nr:CHAT domain-containing protein [Microscillaceae bacterium]